MPMQEYVKAADKNVVTSGHPHGNVASRSKPPSGKRLLADSAGAHCDMFVEATMTPTLMLARTDPPAHSIPLKA
jgi:hypothetical protein